jgi:O-methyltransferase
MSIAKVIYRALPSSAQKMARGIWEVLPWTKAGRHAKWVRGTYEEFSRQQRRQIFLSAARFLHINRPIEGYYFEFGCNEANTMRMAWDSFRYLFDFTYVGFDSFEGLPEITKIDEQDIWEKGKLAFAEERFINICLSHGIPRDRLKIVRGFYDRSLSPELVEQFAPKKAAVIYIDCDLYTSTVSVLRWIPPFLQVGTIIVFDDWNCFNADPDRGERRAWREFLLAIPNLRFEPFVSTAEAQSFICVSLG